MTLPVQITFRKMEPSEAVAARIHEEAEKLDTFYQRITSCRVIIEAPHHHHRWGMLYHITIELGVPGEELVVKHEPSFQSSLEPGGEEKLRKRSEAAAPHKDIYVAIRDAFKAARRQLQDYVRRQRGDVKSHQPPPHAIVTKLFPLEGYGFLRTNEGQEIYFHKNSVSGGSFDQLEIGTEVIFTEEQGQKGPQASTVHVTQKHQPPSLTHEGKSEA